MPPATDHEPEGGPVRPAGAVGRMKRSPFDRRPTFRDIERYLLGRDEPSSRIAAGVGLGIAIGVSPTLGIQTLLAILLAFAFRLPRLDVLVPTAVMNPWTMVPILAFEHWLGALMLGFSAKRGRIEWSLLLHGSPVAAFRTFAPRDLAALFLGGILVATVAGCLTGALTKWVVDRVRILERRAKSDVPGPESQVAGSDVRKHG